MSKEGAKEGKWLTWQPIAADMRKSLGLNIFITSQSETIVTNERNIQVKEALRHNSLIKSINYHMRQSTQQPFLPLSSCLSPFSSFLKPRPVLQPSSKFLILHTICMSFLKGATPHTFRPKICKFLGNFKKKA